MLPTVNGKRLSATRGLLSTAGVAKYVTVGCSANGGTRWQAGSSGNPVVHAILVVLAAAVWLVIQAGKAVLIVLAAIIVVALSVADLVLQLLVMPFVLLARLCGLMRWPVQIEREKRHFRTEHARGFGAAAALRDELALRIERGALEPEPTPSS
jgi:hypothetical protein